MKKDQDSFFAGLSLFASLGTLICCALPALLVTLGLGAVVAGVVSNVPGLIWLSERKAAVFLIAGVMIVIAGIARCFGAKQSCPADPAQAQACTRLKSISAVTYGVSVVLYVVGFFFAFLVKYFI